MSCSRRAAPWQARPPPRSATGCSPWTPRRPSPAWCGRLKGARRSPARCGGCLPPGSRGSWPASPRRWRSALSASTTAVTCSASCASRPPRPARLAGGTAIITSVADAELGRRRAGRPRLRPASDAEVAPRAEILDAAAELFVSQGLAATTTRQIADRVGIRQASLYYYFAGKDEILLELLTESVRPSLRVAAWLESRCRDDPAAGLYALALIDVATLTQAPHNIATLYLMPEVQAGDFASFLAERAQLQAVYGRLGQG